MFKIKDNEISLEEFYQTHTVLGLAGIPKDSTEGNGCNHEVEIIGLTIADLLELLEINLCTNDHRDELGYPIEKDCAVTTTATGYSVSNLIAKVKDELSLKYYSEELGFKE